MLQYLGEKSVMLAQDIGEQWLLANNLRNNHLHRYYGG
jgi:hypothetical protein